MWNATPVHTLLLTVHAAHSWGADNNLPIPWGQSASRTAGRTFAASLEGLAHGDAGQLQVILPQGLSKRLGGCAMKGRARYRIFRNALVFSDNVRTMD